MRQTRAPKERQKGFAQGREPLVTRQQRGLTREDRAINTTTTSMKSSRPKLVQAKRSCLRNLRETFRRRKDLSKGGTFSHQRGCGRP
jgi:hypothetical protein